MIQRPLELTGQLLLRQNALGTKLAARREVAVNREMRVEGHLVGPMTPPPEAVSVARLVDGDPIDPGAKRGLPAEAVNGAEDAKEHFLGKVERFVAVAQQVQGQLEHHALVLLHELSTGLLIARGAALN